MIRMEQQNGMCNRMYDDAMDNDLLAMKPREPGARRPTPGPLLSDVQRVVVLVQLPDGPFPDGPVPDAPVPEAPASAAGDRLAAALELVRRHHARVETTIGTLLLVDVPTRLTHENPIDALPLAAQLATDLSAHPRVNARCLFGLANSLQGFVGDGATLHLATLLPGFTTLLQQLLNIPFGQSSPLAPATH